VSVRNDWIHGHEEANQRAGRNRADQRLERLFDGS